MGHLIKVVDLRESLSMDRVFYDPDTINLQFKYYQWLVGLFIIFYILTNVLAVKVCHFFIFTFLAGIITYPFSYCICDIVTEVYGFQRARQLVYFGVFCSYLFIVCIKFADSLPAENSWHLENSFHDILNSAMPRIMLASTIATIVGDLVNCKLIAKLKIRLNKWMWFRFVSSTAIGTIVDNTTFTMLAFWGTKPIEWILILLLNQYCLKLSYLALLSPLSVRISRFLKKAEKSDIYDSRTNFSPFNLKIAYTKDDNYYGRKFGKDDR